MCPTNNITVNEFHFDKLWSSFSKEFGQIFKLLSSCEHLWADQCLCENGWTEDWGPGTHLRVRGAARGTVRRWLQ